MKYESEAEKVLRQEYRWYEGIAKAAVSSNGYCVYCDEDLLESLVSYSAMQMDHLLPKSKYPEFEWNTENHVLCCFSCNGMKGNYDPAECLDVPDGMALTAQKVELIRRVKAHLSVRIGKRKAEWEKVAEHIRG